MTKLSFKTKLILFFGIYLLFRISIFNINAAEWGDSYRILRATNFLEKNTYPKDEKRPPLYSAFLILNPNNIDPIYSSRILMIGVSLLTLFIFYLVLNRINYSLTENQKLLALVLFAFNPLYLYWSIRIYADTFFLLLALLAILIYFIHQKNPKLYFLVLLSLVCFLGIMTRFEGYILSTGIFLSFVFEAIRNKSWDKFKYGVIFGIFLSIFFGLAVNTPWLFFKNPMTSSYVDEANRREIVAFDMLSYFLQVMFLLGNLFSVYFFAVGRKKILKFLIDNSAITAFVLIELVLALAWPAAVPRLLVQLVPFLIIPLVIGLYEVPKLKNHYLILFLLLGIFVGGQYLSKAQLMLTNLSYFAVICLLSLVQIYLIIKKKFSYVVISLIVINVIWSLLFIFLHKDIYRVLNTGVVEFSKVYQNDGIIVSNDVSYLTKFYFGDNLKYLREVDFGKDIEKYLREKKASYIIVTNEHNADMTYSKEKYPYLTPIYEYKRNVNGRDFFVVISKVNLPVMVK